MRRVGQPRSPGRRLRFTGLPSHRQRTRREQSTVNRTGTPADRDRGAVRSRMRCYPARIEQRNLHFNVFSRCFLNNYGVSINAIHHMQVRGAASSELTCLGVAVSKRQVQALGRGREMYDRLYIIKKITFMLHVGINMRVLREYSVVSRQRRNGRWKCGLVDQAPGLWHGMAGLGAALGFIMPGHNLRIHVFRQHTLSGKNSKFIDVKKNNYSEDYAQGNFGLTRRSRIKQ